MKKSLLLSAVLGMAAAANAQTESAVMDIAALGIGSDAVAVAAGTELCSSANVIMSAAFDCDYKSSAMSGSEDPVRSLSIAGVTYELPAGVQGQTNPSPNSLTNGGQQAGAVFKFEVKADGVLYVFAKLTYNKNYYVWEGDVVNSAAMPVAYSLQAYPVATGTKTGYTLPGDEFGYYEMGTGYDDGTMYYQAAQCIAVANGGAAVDAEGNKLYDASWASGNALGVIAFPVYAEAGEYYVNACGSKVTCNGFVFIPGATEIAEINVGGAEPEPTPEETVKTLWTNATGDAVPAWGSVYRFCNDEHKTGEEIYSFSMEDWALIKEGIVRAYVELTPASNIRICDGWWSTTYGGAEHNCTDFVKTDNDGNTYVELNIKGEGSMYDSIDEKHLLFTGSDYTLKSICVETGSTGINNVKAEASATVSYNLFGQKANATSGLMIKNGNKVLVK